MISKIDYCNSLYYGLPKSQHKKLRRILNRSVRLIKGLSPYDRVTPSMIELHLLPIRARIEYKVSVLTFQALKMGKPEYIRRLLSEFSTGSNLVLRHNTEINRLNEPRHNLSLGARAFKMSAPRVFNRLPIQVRDCNTCDSFKKKLKTHLFQKCYDLNDETINDAYMV